MRYLVLLIVFLFAIPSFAADKNSIVYYFANKAESTQNNSDSSDIPDDDTPSYNCDTIDEPNACEIRETVEGCPQNTLTIPDGIGCGSQCCYGFLSQCLDDQECVECLDHDQCQNGLYPYCIENRCEDCSAGYEFYQERCAPVCTAPGMTGERDENGDCICSGASCICPEGHMLNPDNTCVYCPTKTADGETCETKCTFASTDPVGCCKMVVFDGRENCLENNYSDTYLANVIVDLGYDMKGTYRVTYDSGAVTNSRFVNNPQWFVGKADDYLWLSNPTKRVALPGYAGYYPSIEAAEAANKGLSITWTFNQQHIVLYRRDGAYWYFYGTSGPGCSDNCGQIRYLFEKIAE